MSLKASLVLKESVPTVPEAVQTVVLIDRVSSRLKESSKSARIQ
jgi:hypothetical protein